MEGLFYRYIHENAEAFATGEIDQQKQIFIANLLAQYGFSSGEFVWQTGVITSIFNSISERQITQYKNDNPELWESFLQDPSPDSRRRLYEQIWSEMGWDAWTRLQEIQERYPNIKDIPSIPNEPSKAPHTSDNSWIREWVWNHQIHYEVWGTDENPTLISWATQIPISREEAQILQNNPEAQKNYIETYTAFEASWLLKLWNIRDSIFTSISNVKWLAFNINWDFINKNELKILFDSILISVDEKPIQEWTLSVNWIVNEMERRNWTNADGSETEVNFYWETRVEALFLERYFPKWGIVFEHQAFESSLSS